MTQGPHPHPGELWPHVRGGGGVPHKDREEYPPLGTPCAGR